MYIRHILNVIAQVLIQINDGAQCHQMQSQIPQFCKDITGQGPPVGSPLVVLPYKDL